MNVRLLRMLSKMLHHLSYSLSQNVPINKHTSPQTSIVITAIISEDHVTNRIITAIIMAHANEERPTFRPTFFQQITPTPNHYRPTKLISAIGEKDELNMFYERQAIFLTKCDGGSLTELYRRVGRRVHTQTEPERQT